MLSIHPVYLKYRDNIVSYRIVTAADFLLFYRVIPHPSLGATRWRLKAAAAPPCPCAGPAKTPTTYSTGRRSTRARRSTPARGRCCRTTWWTPERYGNNQSRADSQMFCVSLWSLGNVSPVWLPQKGWTQAGSKLRIRCRFAWLTHIPSTLQTEKQKCESDQENLGLIRSQCCKRKTCYKKVP